MNDDQDQVNSPPLTDENIWVVLFVTVQDITTQAQYATTQAQAVTAKANQEVVPRAHQQVATMTSRLRDFTRMNLSTF